jgi:hypothetical protein
MQPTWLLLLLPALMGQAPAPKSDSAAELAAKLKHERLVQIYTADAAIYSIYRDAKRQEKLELDRTPVYVWTNPLRDGGQDGVVFVWTCRGRAEVLGCVFSAPATGERKLYHEFHSLSLSVLDVTRPGAHSWAPEAAGIELTPLAAAQKPGRTGPQRLAQMRALTRDFAATTEDDKGKSWELRLLPRPLYRYESTDPNVLDGALFCFVTSAGTDPEALLILEARKPGGDRDAVWHFAIARFTDLKLAVRHKGEVVFTAPLIPYNVPQQDPKHRYRVINDRVLPPVEDQAR